MQHDTILNVEQIEKSLGHGAAQLKILGGLSLRAEAGEFISVVGPSGCGKTTLLMCLAGLLSVDSGSVSVLGERVSEPPPGLSVVFQDYSRSLLPWKRNLDNVLFGMRRVDATKDEKQDYAREMLAAVGLEGFGQKYPWELSGGMQQRVAIARALATKSRLLLLDEPLAAVDAQTRAEMQDLILGLAQKFSRTCILVTHDVDEAVYLADRIVVLSSRPTQVVEEVAVNLPKPRDQIETRELPEYLSIRHEVLSRIKAMKKPQSDSRA